MLAAPLVVVLVLAVAFGAVSDSAWAQGALRGMGAVSAGLIAATALKLFPALHSNAMRGSVCLLFAGVSFAGVALLRLPLAAVLLGIGGLAWLWAWFVLGRQAGRPQDQA